MKKNKAKDLLSVRVITRAKCNKIIGWQDNFLKIKLTAAPIKGEANNKLLDFLADYLQVSKNELKIIKGHNTNKKYISLPSGLLDKF